VDLASGISAALGITQKKILPFHAKTFEVLTAVQMKVQVFCDMKSRSVIVTDVSEKLAGLTFRKETLLRLLSRQKQQATPKRR
jgi:hypothetical protein